MKEILGRLAGQLVLIAMGVAPAHSAPPTKTVRSTSPEPVPAGEAAAIRAIVTTVEQTVNAAYAGGQRPALRDAHAKAQGCVRAEVVVLPNLPSALRQGVFGQPRSYPAWIRFSNGNGAPQDDHTGDGRGMAIKLMGVEGRKLLSDESTATTQDLVMINHPVFFVRNVIDYVSFTALTKNNKGNEFFASRPHEAAIAKAITSTTVDQVFEQRYFSMTPYQLGQRVMKFSAIPVVCSSRAKIAPSTAAPPAGDANYLRDGMIAWLSAKDACFDLAVQPRTESGTMPIEDPTIEWSETEAPFVNVATIRIPQQSFTSPAQQRFCENLSMTPWHSLPAHRPLGGINRLRKDLYQSISKLRHQLNAAPRREPTGNETFE